MSFDGETSFSIVSGLRDASQREILTATSSQPTPGPSRTPTRIRRSQNGPIDREILTNSDGSYTRPILSASASFTSSRPLSRSSSIDSESFSARLRKAAPADGDVRIRRESVGPDGVPIFQSHSAYHFLKAVNSIDYSGATGPATSNNPITAATTPGTTTATTAVATAPEPWTGAPPIAWAHSNALVFGRGVRVFYKNMADTEGVAAQLCKLADGSGGLRHVAAAGDDTPQLIALATHGGHLQLWDLGAKRTIGQWRLKDPSALVFNRTLLTVGDDRGAVRHYDTRITDMTKMREQVMKATRHQGKISSLAWYRDGNLLASGDEHGQVLVWDIRKPRIPLDNVGEMVQRRRKMQHNGIVSVSLVSPIKGFTMAYASGGQALAWCPWYGKYLVSGDASPDGTGILRVWDIANPDSAGPLTAERPTKIELDAPVTSIHFSPHINEVLTTHGAGARTEVPTLNAGGAEPLKSRLANSLVVHQFPRMRSIRTKPVAQHALAGSVLSPNGHRVAVAVPEEGQLKVWDVWGKLREGPRQSFSSCTIR